ncbi:MAG: hypothetical protein E6G94_02130 [Alphaproteobacteria bacterium]|nr:MAG: hypothetical protein E6G94_02130 [Alphaproteobacteria bacterium]
MKSFWTGISLGGRARSQIATWRCGRCGFLESYAAGAADDGAEAQKQEARVVLFAAVVLAFVLALVAGVLAARG